MRRMFLRLLSIAALAAAGGCVTAAVAPSTAGQAWIMRGHVFSSSLWHCDASAGEPTCTEVTNQPAGAAEAPKGG